MVQGNRSAGYKARTEPDSKGLSGAGTTKQKGRGQREPTDGLESQHGTANVEPKDEDIGRRPPVELHTAQCGVYQGQQCDVTSWIGQNGIYMVERVFQPGFDEFYPEIWTGRCLQYF